MWQCSLQLPKLEKKNQNQKTQKTHGWPHLQINGGVLSYTFRRCFEAHKYLEIKGQYFNRLTTNWADGQRMFPVLTGVFTLRFSFLPPGRREEVKTALPELNKHFLTNSALCQRASVSAFEMPSSASPIAANICCSSTSHTLLTLFFFRLWGSIVNKFTGQI